MNLLFKISPLLIWSMIFFGSAAIVNWIPNYLYFVYPAITKDLVHWISLLIALVSLILYLLIGIILLMITRDLQCTKTHTYYVGESIRKQRKGVHIFLWPKYKIFVAHIRRGHDSTAPSVEVTLFSKEELQGNIFVHADALVENGQILLAMRKV